MPHRDRRPPPGALGIRPRYRTPALAAWSPPLTSHERCPLPGLAGGFGRAGGGIDAKTTSVTLAAAGLATYGRAGPTNDDQPTFCWTRAFRQTPHAGHPHCYDYEWAAFKPM